MPSAPSCPPPVVSEATTKSLRLAPETPEAPRASRLVAVPKTNGEALHDDLVRTGRFCTLFASHFSPDGTVRFVNLGHPPALVYRQATRTVERLEATAPPLGVSRGHEHRSRRVQLQPGDQLIIYSDGVTEASHPEAPDRLFGEQKLHQAILGSDHPDTTLGRLHAALEGWVVRDDVTVAVIQRTESP